MMKRVPPAPFFASLAQRSEFRGILAPLGRTQGKRACSVPNGIDATHRLFGPGLHADSRWSRAAHGVSVGGSWGER
jgi:hypothetical protein